jgi:dolichyl-phosphate beta-glucosyltransferase
MQVVAATVAANPLPILQGEFVERTSQRSHGYSLHANGKDAFTVRADHDLTLIIPAFNEEKRLPWTLNELKRSLTDWGIDYRVLVADDGSSDRTPTLASLLGSRFSTISLAEHRGKGCAVRAAMLRATGRVVAFTDADLPYEFSALRDGYQPIRDGACEVVFGARDVRGADHRTRRRLSRILSTWVFRNVVKRLISREVTDTQCGLKIFSLAAAHEIFSRTTLDGFAFDAEVVLLTEHLGLPFRRIPVSLAREDASSLSIPRDALPMLRDVVAVWWRNRVCRVASPPRLFEPDLASAEPRRKSA